MAKGTTTPTCQRPKCSNTLAPGRLKYCSPECAREAQLEQLQAITERRRKQREGKPLPKCSIPGCGKPFKPTSSSHKYCSDACSLKGLQAAIDRQRARREEAKKLRKAHP